MMEDKKEYQKKWRRENKNYMKDYMKIYNQIPEVKEKRKKWMEENKEHIREYGRRFCVEYQKRPEVKEAYKRYYKRYEEKNRERRKEYHDALYQRNKDRISERNKIHSQKPEVKERTNRYSRERRKNDPIFRIKSRIRCRFGEAIDIFSKTGKVSPLEIAISLYCLVNSSLFSLLCPSGTPFSTISLEYIFQAASGLLAAAILVRTLVPYNAGKPYLMAVAPTFVIVGILANIAVTPIAFAPTPIPAIAKGNAANAAVVATAFIGFS